MTSKHAETSGTPGSARETIVDDRTTRDLAEPVDTSHSPPQGPVSRDTGGGARSGSGSTGLLAA